LYIGGGFVGQHLIYYSKMAFLIQSHLLCANILMMNALFFHLTHSLDHGVSHVEYFIFLEIQVFPFVPHDFVMDSIRDILANQNQPNTT